MRHFLSKRVCLLYVLCSTKKIKDPCCLFLPFLRDDRVILARKLTLQRHIFVFCLFSLLGLICFGCAWCFFISFLVHSPIFDFLGSEAELPYDPKHLKRAPSSSSFPKSRLLRMGWDRARAPGDLDRQLSSAAQENLKILDVFGFLVSFFWSVFGVAFLKPRGSQIVVLIW